MENLEKYFTQLAIKCLEENQIDIKKLGSRLMTIDDLDEAFSFKTRGRKTIYPNWAYKKAKENGITRQTLYNRIHKQGMSIEEAVSRKLLR